MCDMHDVYRIIQTCDGLDRETSKDTISDTTRKDSFKQPR